jgi:hypothetical protein
MEKEMIVLDSPERIAFDIKARYAIALRGKYVKQSLENLEAHDLLDPVTRKIVLDAWGDYGRQLEIILRG